ncbi:2-hydroxyacid dehydrogenase [Pseudonocardia sp. GCM10023141]|uniref:2-hydroxyacid dehydrogenase n=1 Tax=Pseudonocardia sp. GCM10023141 TaxID=3252653 RepID=UPI003613F4D0
MKVVVVDQNLVPLRAELEAGLPPGTVAVWPRPADIEAELVDADVLVSGVCTAAMGAAGKGLRLVHSVGAGTDRIDAAALPPGTVVANTFHHEDSMAEYVVAATVLLRRGFLRQDAALRRDEWATPVYRPDAPWTVALPGATVGFVGFGHIGARTWERFRAFGASGITVTRRGDVDAAAHGLEWSGSVDDLDALLSASDVVVVSVPLTPETTGLIDARRLALMRATAVLVNVGRGPLVDEHALFTALRERTIGAAAVDVWYRYPDAGGVAAPSALPFHELDNVLMTPHSSGLTQQTFVARAADIAANIRRLAAAEPLVNVVTVA